MPTYEYVCTECGAPLEVVQSIHDATLTQCPACQGRLRKVFGNVGVVFKGSGFYRTDSRGKPSAAATSTPKVDTKGAAATSDTSSTADSKGAAPAAAPSAPAKASTKSPATNAPASS